MSLNDYVTMHTLAILRDKLVHMMIKEKEDIEPFVNVRSLYAIDLGDREYTKEEIKNRRLISVSWYRLYNRCYIYVKCL